MGLPVPARPGELDRGRHHRDPAEHRRRAGARTAEEPMNFELTDEQQSIQSTARELLTRRVTREAIDAHDGFDGALWDEVSQLGWPGLAVAEEHGGQGLGLLELALIVEELGRTLAPLPLVANASAALALS